MTIKENNLFSASLSYHLYMMIDLLTSIFYGKIFYTFLSIPPTLTFFKFIWEKPYL